MTGREQEGEEREAHSCARGKQRNKQGVRDAEKFPKSLLRVISLAELTQT